MMYMCCDTGIFYFDNDSEVWKFLHSLAESDIEECGDSVLLAAAIGLAGHSVNHHKLRCGEKVYSIPCQNVLEDMLRPCLYTAETSKYGKQALEVFINYCEVKK